MQKLLLSTTTAVLLFAAPTLHAGTVYIAPSPAWPI
jgi:hypothetical protein